MRKFTQKEKETYNKLESKRKSIEREMKQFYKDADEHKEELLKRWGIELPEERKMRQLYKDADEHKNELLRRWGIELPPEDCDDGTEDPFAELANYKSNEEDDGAGDLFDVLADYGNDL